MRTIRRDRHMSAGRKVVNVVKMNPNKQGPIELQLVESARQWTANGGAFSCWFTDPPPEWYAKLMAATGGTIGVLGKTPDHASWDREVLRIAAVERPDLLHIHFGFHTAAPTLAADGVLVVVTEHMERYPARLEVLRRVVRHRRQRSVAAFVAVSRAVAVQTRRDYLIPAGKVNVIYNGVDLQRFRPRPEEKARLRETLLGITDDRPVLTLAAHLIPRKRQSMLVESLPALLRHEAATHVVLAGGGPDEQLLRQLICQMSLQDNVSFLTGDNDVAALYAASDVGVLVSEREALGGSAVEALACGLPLVATPVGGLLEVPQEGVSGLLVRDQTAAGLAEALLPLVTDRGLRERMGAAGRVRAESVFALPAAASATLSLYDRLLSQAALVPHRP